MLPGGLAEPKTEAGLGCSPLSLDALERLRSPTQPEPEKVNDNILSKPKYSKHQFEVLLRYMMPELYWECRTIVSVSAEASTVELLDWSAAQFDDVVDGLLGVALPQLFLRRGFLSIFRTNYGPY